MSQHPLHRKTRSIQGTKTEVRRHKVYVMLYFIHLIFLNKITISHLFFIKIIWRASTTLCACMVRLYHAVGLCGVLL
jgi:hypothetical protein